MMKLNLNKIFTLRAFAVFLIVVFCSRYIPIDTRAGVSMFKIVVAGCCVPVFFVAAPYASKAFFCIIMYLLAIALSVLYNFDTIRISTLLYMLSFLLSFLCFYNLVYIRRVLSLQYFIDFVKGLIYVYVSVLLVQQIFILLGVKYFPLINLSQVLNRGIGANSLTGEPSVLGRLVSVLLYAYMECVSFRDGRRFSFFHLWAKEHRWVTICYVWAVLTMGSGTAFVATGILSLYFINWRNFFFIIPLFVGVFFVGLAVGNPSLDRAVNSAKATISMDKGVVMKADGSAAHRIVPVLNTIKNLDLTNIDHWLGYGVDSTNESDLDEKFIGGIGDYGFLQYIFGLILVFSCSIRFFSIPTIMFFIGVGGGTGNIPYGWGILMIFTCVRYFHDNRHLFAVDRSIPMGPVNQQKRNLHY